MNVVRSAFLMTTISLLLSGCAEALDAESQPEAIKAAERFIRENGYDTARKCPDELAEREAKGFYDMQPPCQHYAASEARAFAVLETEIFWRVYFRNVPPDCYPEGESFRIVEVFRASFPDGPRVWLKDIEQSLDHDAVRLRPNNAMQPTCEAHAADGERSARR